MWQSTNIKPYTKYLMIKNSLAEFTLCTKMFQSFIQDDLKVKEYSFLNCCENNVHFLSHSS